MSAEELTTALEYVPGGVIVTVDGRTYRIPQNHIIHLRRILHGLSVEHRPWCPDHRVQYADACAGCRSDVLAGNRPPNYTGRHYEAR